MRPIHFLLTTIGVGILLLAACAERRVCRQAEVEEHIQGCIGVSAAVSRAGRDEDTGGLKKIDVAGADPQDRDLGPGADGEKLGNPRGDPQEATDPTTGERYARVVDNAFVRTSQAGGDASTFGLDVDSASYANCRRFLYELNRLPPPGAVRIEELVNTLTYGYPAPGADEVVPFRASAAVATCPWAPAHRLVRVALRARTVTQAARPPLNLVFLVDTSGSMSDANKLPLVQRSLLLLAEQLAARDRLAIVTYAGSAGTLLPATAGSEQRLIREAIRSLRSGGSTNGAGGISAAYAEAVRGAAAGTISRVMLCTDGDFNVGTTGLPELQALIERQRATGVFLNVYGFGMGNYKDQTLEMLADRGNGIYGYVDREAEAQRLFDREVLGQLVTVAKDAKVQVFFNPAAVGAWRLLGYENRVLRREDFQDDRVDAGDIGAGHTVTALYEIVPAGAADPLAARPGDANPFIASSTGLAGDPSVLLRVRLRWKEPEAQTSRLLEQDVAAAVGSMDADFRTAAAAAGFGMLLRRSPWSGACDWAMVAGLAEEGRGEDANGRRGEFLDLVRRAAALAGRR